MDPATSVWSLPPKLCRQRKSGFHRDLAWLGQQFSTAAVRSWGSCLVLFQVVLSYSNLRVGNWCERAAKRRELECPCSGVFWLGWAGIHGRSCDAIRKDCRALGFCGRSQNISHGSLGCSFSAYLHFPIWTPLNCWGAGSRAMDKQQEEAVLRQELLRNKGPSVPAAHAETCSTTWCGWQSSCGSPTVCQRGSGSVLQGIPALLLFQCPPAAQAFQP